MYDLSLVIAFFIYVGRANHTKHMVSYDRPG
jgi:hypothetical protein